MRKQNQSISYDAIILCHSRALYHSRALCHSRAGGNPSSLLPLPLRVSVAVLAIVVLCFSGCGIQRRPPAEKHYFLLNIQRPDAPVETKPAVCLYVRPCRVALPFAERSLVYRTGTVLYEQDYYNLFLTNPDDQITDAMRLWFRQFGLAECVSMDETAAGKYTLESRIDILCADFSDKENPAAVVRMHVLLTKFDPSCSCPKAVLEKTFTARTPLPPKPTAAQVVEGLSVSMSQILQDLESSNTEI